MGGYKIKFILQCQTETWREAEIPDNITFERLQYIIHRLFGFYNAHLWEFRIPKQSSESSAINLDDIDRFIEDEEAYDVIISEVFDEYNVLVYEYDFGAGWEIIVHKLEDTKYKNKTALITDYKGKYNPNDDLGGVDIFDEIMEAVGTDDLYDVLDSYGMNEYYLETMDFEKRYKKGSRIRLNDPVRTISIY